MLLKSIRDLIKRGTGPAALAAALVLAATGLFVASDAYALERFPNRIENLTLVSASGSSANISWDIQAEVDGYEVGLWSSGQLFDLPTAGASATISVPDIFEKVPTPFELPSRLTGDYLGSRNVDEDYLGVLTADPSIDGTKFNLLEYGPYYYYNSRAGIWRTVFRPQGSQARWVDMPGGGPTGWLAVYATETDAISHITAMDQKVMFLDALSNLTFWNVQSVTATASITGIPSGLQYLSVRGVDSPDNKGEWAYLVTVGTAGTAPTAVAGAPVALSGLIYTDEVPNIEHYLQDETTLILGWQNIPGARHYDVRLNGKVTRIPALASSGQQVAVSLASLDGKNLSYQVRAVIETGTLDVRVKDVDDELIYIVPPNSIVYSRWSADRSVNVERLDMIKGPGTESLMTDPGPPSDTITDLIGDLLKLATVIDEDADAGDVQLWTVPLGLLGSIFLGGLTGYGAGRGRMDKAAIVAGGLVFFVCWAYLCPVYLKIPWQVIFAVIVVVMGAGIAIAINDYLR